MSSNREAFLANIADRLGRPTPSIAPNILPSVTARKLQGDVIKHAGAKDCVDLFIKRFTAQGGTAVYADSLAVITDILKGNQEKHSLNRAFLWNDVRIERLGIKGTLNDIGIELTNNPLKADMGITFAEWGIAETGTCAVYNGPGKPRAASLVPNSFIVFIREKAIVPTMDYVLEDMSKIADADGLPSCVNLIAGPSSSADIELELVIGIHGPTFVTAVITSNELMQTLQTL